MKIVTLVENSAVSPEYGCKHGLSFYIETQQHKLLFDVGPNALFIENAKKLGVALSAVDTVIISHGHYDHGGGLRPFMEINKTAKIYLHETAFGEYYSGTPETLSYIGLEPLGEDPRLILTGAQLRIDDELFLFSDVVGHEYFPTLNKRLYMKLDGQLLGDDFRHEQNLIITEHGRHTLFAGCAHKGIVNVCRRAEENIGAPLDTVIAGFHLGGSNENEPDARIASIANALSTSKASYFTGHCTGIHAFGLLKQLMGDKIAYLATGSSITL
jgi:7,8-dihydropterin-6-yl-methyl-4-(beta-D-ribofuranosyl)aminobenzene 5'-phosphate synthase